MDAIFGGWRLSGIFQARSGFPITVTDGRAALFRAPAATSARTASAIRRRRIRTSITGSTSTPLPSAPLGTFGNCPIGGGGRAPGYKNIDAVLAKQFNVGGSRYFEFRAEAFNFTNHAELQPAGS